MITTFSKEVEDGRALDGPYGSSAGDRFGAFRIRRNGLWFLMLASDGDPEVGIPWEHVSVSTKLRCPTWDEMCWVKDLFWGPEEAVMQLHPPRSDYVNFHPHCLHLWRPMETAVPLPPSIAVGPRRPLLAGGAT